MTNLLYIAVTDDTRDFIEESLDDQNTDDGIFQDSGYTEDYQGFPLDVFTVNTDDPAFETFKTKFIKGYSSQRAGFAEWPAFAPLANFMDNIEDPDSFTVTLPAGEETTEWLSSIFLSEAIQNEGPYQGDESLNKIRLTFKKDQVTVDQRIALSIFYFSLKQGTASEEEIVARFGADYLNFYIFAEDYLVPLETIPKGVLAQYLTQFQEIMDEMSKTWDTVTFLNDFVHHYTDPFGDLAGKFYQVSSFDPVTREANFELETDTADLLFSAGDAVFDGYSFAGLVEYVIGSLNEGSHAVMYEHHKDYAEGKTDWMNLYGGLYDIRYILAALTNVATTAVKLPAGGLASIVDTCFYIPTSSLQFYILGALQLAEEGYDYYQTGDPIKMEWSRLFTDAYSFAGFYGLLHFVGNVLESGFFPVSVALETFLQSTLDLHDVQLPASDETIPLPWMDAEFEKKLRPVTQQIIQDWQAGNYTGMVSNGAAGTYSAYIARFEEEWWDVTKAIAWRTATNLGGWPDDPNMPTDMKWQSVGGTLLGYSIPVAAHARSRMKFKLDPTGMDPRLTVPREGIPDAPQIKPLTLDNKAARTVPIDSLAKPTPDPIPVDPFPPGKPSAAFVDEATGAEARIIHGREGAFEFAEAEMGIKGFVVSDRGVRKSGRHKMDADGHTFIHTPDGNIHGIPRGKVLINEDGAAVVKVGEKLYIISVDGMGGHGHGNYAMKHILYEIATHLMEGKTPIEALNLARKKLTPENGLSGSGACFVIAEYTVKDGQPHVQFINSGDSKAVHFRPGEGEVFRTRDGSKVQELRELTEDGAPVTEENRITNDFEQRTHREANKVVNPLMGFREPYRLVDYETARDNARDPFVFYLSEERALKPGDVVVEASDSLWGNYDVAQVWEMIKDTQTPEEATLILKTAVVEKMKSRMPDAAPDNLNISVTFTEKIPGAITKAKKVARALSEWEGSVTGLQDATAKIKTVSDNMKASIRRVEEAGTLAEKEVAFAELEKLMTELETAEGEFQTAVDQQRIKQEGLLTANEQVLPAEAKPTRAKVDEAIREAVQTKNDAESVYHLVRSNIERLRDIDAAMEAVEPHLKTFEAAEKKITTQVELAQEKARLAKEAQSEVEAQAALLEAQKALEEAKSAGQELSSAFDQIEQTSTLMRSLLGDPLRSKRTVLDRVYEEASEAVREAEESLNRFIEEETSPPPAETASAVEIAQEQQTRLRSANSDLLTQSQEIKGLTSRIEGLTDLAEAEGLLSEVEALLSGLHEKHREISQILGKLESDNAAGVRDIKATAIAENRPILMAFDETVAAGKKAQKVVETLREQAETKTPPPAPPLATGSQYGFIYRFYSDQQPVQLVIPFELDKQGRLFLLQDKITRIPQENGPKISDAALGETARKTAKEILSIKYYEYLILRHQNEVSYFIRDPISSRWRPYHGEIPEGAEPIEITRAKSYDGAREAAEADETRSGQRDERVHLEEEEIPTQIWQTSPLIPFKEGDVVSLPIEIGESMTIEAQFRVEGLNVILKPELNADIPAEVLVEIGKLEKIVSDPIDGLRFTFQRDPSNPGTWKLADVESASD